MNAMLLLVPIGWGGEDSVCRGFRVRAETSTRRGWMVDGGIVDVLH